MENNGETFLEITGKSITEDNICGIDGIDGILEIQSCVF
jgi:hypothetical protein